jgi:hypothetical protein
MDSSQPRAGQPPPSVANSIRRKRLYNNFECANKLLYHCSEWCVPASPASSPSNSHYLGLTAGIDSLTGAPIYGGVPGSPTDAHVQWMIVPNSDNSIRYSSLCHVLSSSTFPFCSTFDGAISEAC